MFCIKCGKVMPDGSKFCPFCGEPVFSVQNHTGRICPGCGNTVDEGLLFCNRCGTKMDAAVQPAPRQQAREQLVRTMQNVQEQKKGGSGERAERPRPVKVSWYPGNKKLGIAKATGLLNVYQDHLEFYKTMGSSGAAALGLVGIAVSSSKAKKEQAVIFEMSDIARAMESKYMGAFPAMVVEMKNGETHTFAGTMNGTDLRRCIEFINRYAN